MADELDGLDATLGALVELMRQVAAKDLPIEFETRGPESIRRLGLTSVRILEFMVEVEDRFGVIWDEDLDPTVIASFDAMAAYLLKSAGGNDVKTG